MLTPSSALVKRLEDEIRMMPVVDLHSHLFGGRSTCQARTLLDLVGYHFVECDLISAGMPVETFKDADRTDPASALAAVRKALPYLSHCRNTGTFQCLETMLLDLYGIEAPLAPENAQKTFDAVLKTAADPDWPRKVLCDRLHARHIVTQLSSRPVSTGLPDDLIGYTWEARGPFEWRPMRNLLEPHADGLDSARGIADAAGRLVASAVEDGARSFTTHLPAEFVFVDVDAAAIDGQCAGDEDALSSWALKCLLGAMNERAMPMVVSVGAFWPAYPTAPHGVSGRSISEFRPTTFRMLGEAAARFPRVNFFIMLASPVMNHDLAMLAKMVPNVIPTGYWWHCMYPGFVGRLLRERLDIVPHNKIIGFFSDGYHAEWCYAKWRLVARETALVLAAKIEGGYFDETFAVEAARAIFGANPARFYGLDGS